MDDESPEDPLPALRAEMDQAIMSAPLVAQVCRGYFDAFVAEGFSEPQALYLTVCQLKDAPGPPPK